MSAMKWIKLSTALFEDEKMLLLEQQENGHALQLLWVKLLCLAGKQGREGKIFLTEGIPYTPHMLATILRLEQPLLERGLEALRRFGMVGLENGTITITNWSRYQSMTAQEKKRAYDREYQQRRRSEQGYGCYRNVPLTDEQDAELKAEFPADFAQRLDRLSEYMRQSGKSYADPLAVIRKWAKEDEKTPKKKRSFLELAEELL